MPIDNLGKIHLNNNDSNTINQKLDELLNLILPYTTHLTPAERRKYGKVNEKNKLLINKTNDYHQSMPSLQSPEVDWVEFEKDYTDRRLAETMLQKIQSIERQVQDFKILRDYDNYTDSRRDYQFCKYKNSFANQVGYGNKIDEMKVFFPKTGKKKVVNKQ